MKIFKKKINNKKISRNTLRQYALSRRASLLPKNCTFKDLEHFHIYESTGILPVDISLQIYRKTNGFASRKWALEYTVKKVKEDIMSGDFIKFDFYRSKISGWYYKIVLENLIVKTNFFPRLSNI